MSNDFELSVLFSGFTESSVSEIGGGGDFFVKRIPPSEHNYLIGTLINLLFYRGWEVGGGAVTVVVNCHRGDTPKKKKQHSLGTAVIYVAINLITDKNIVCVCNRLGCRAG